MSAIARTIFSFLQTQTLRAFGEGSYLFFPAARGGATYTVIVPCTAGTNRGQSKGLPGLLTLPTDSRVFDVAEELVPFAPRPDDLILFGTPIEQPGSPGTLIADPSAPPEKYRITAAHKATYHTHWHITAERH